MYLRLPAENRGQNTYFRTNKKYNLEEVQRGTCLPSKSAQQFFFRGNILTFLRVTKGVWLIVPRG